MWAANQVAQMIEAGFHNPPLLTREQVSELIRIASDLVGLTKLAQILGVSATAVYEWQIRGAANICALSAPGACAESPFGRAFDCGCNGIWTWY